MCRNVIHPDIFVGEPILTQVTRVDLASVDFWFHTGHKHDLDEGPVHPPRPPPYWSVCVTAVPTVTLQDNSEAGIQRAGCFCVMILFIIDEECVSVTD